MENTCNRPFNVELPDESATLQSNLKENFYYKEYQKQVL